MDPAFNGFGTASAPEPVQTHQPNVTPPDHRLPDHGTPDPVRPAFGAPAFGSPVSPVMPPAPAASPSFVPEPPRQSGNLLSQGDLPDDRPVPVVKVLSVRGIEYAMMSLFLWAGAAALIWLLVSLVLGGNSFAMMAFPVSLLLVSLPGFAWLFLRLRKAELANPAMRLEASKRRYSQITQIVAFLACFSNIVTAVYVLMSKVGGEDGAPVGKTLGSTAIVLVVAGGILAYYWRDEHKLIRN